ncbi:uncharacterized protein PV06_10410 [Exophiala oligosperma]|uniref:Uncharacterized protein n=1 Tax=Exophiala oligosperma TaxID=215243 RepID=A0A0D2AAI2_9EURO|nr:uncharacterized protein PV06_10410 [Exophiala oligosperma]KIW37366.1 hypothetical protein PV06_10410 [Exophiala oligosperma]
MTSVRYASVPVAQTFGRRLLSTTTCFALRHYPTTNLVQGEIVRRHGICHSRNAGFHQSLTSQNPSRGEPLNASPRVSKQTPATPTSTISLSDESFQAWPEMQEMKNQPNAEDDLRSDEREAYTATEVDLDTENGGLHKQNSLRKRLDSLISIFMPSRARQKMDLSYRNPIEWEQNLSKLETPATLEFRSSTPLRKLLLEYLLHVEPCLSGDLSQISSDDDRRLTDALEIVFSEENIAILDKIGYSVTDVVSWAWIFTSGSVEGAVQKYVVLTATQRSANSGRVPKFILLQILRAPQVNAFALKRLIDSILAELQLCKKASQYPGWGWTTRVCLVVRLLRHARQVAPESFKDVSTIIEHLFSDFYKADGRSVEAAELKRLSHVFNRFLTLVSVPTSRTFNSYLVKQNTQLSLVRLMVGFKPQIPLTREGYRALITVQLQHPKTEQERAWAETKSLSWPPWRRINSGIEQDLSYPGKESRAMKLLRRMNQAGYTHGAWERSAAILAGWDTDKSPTIQTRANLRLPRQAWKIKKQTVDFLDSSSHEAAETWAARIQATRTKREAWACFRSYERNTEMSRRRYQPYFAMCHKLLASTATLDSVLGSRHIAGDLKEVFEEPVSPREITYVDREVPSLSEFYDDMLRVGIVPGGRLLGELLDLAPSIEAGFAYIQDSRWDEVTKDVLRHAENYPPTIIRDTLSRVPHLCLAAFVYLLSRHGFENVPDFAVMSEKHDKHTGQWMEEKRYVKPLTYAIVMLRVGECKNTLVWNAFLRGTWASIRNINDKVREGSLTPLDKRHMNHQIWDHLQEQFESEQTELNIHPDLETFRLMAGILTFMVKEANHGRLRIHSRELRSLAKVTFVRAVYGRIFPDFLPSRSVSVLRIPDPSDLQLMVRILVSVGDVEGLVAMVEWINSHGEDDTITRDKSTVSIRSVLCTIRLFLEGSPTPAYLEQLHHFESPLTVPADMIERAKDACGPLKWPSDEEIEIFLSHESEWMKRVARTVRRPRNEQFVNVNVSHESNRQVEDQTWDDVQEGDVRVEDVENSPVPIRKHLS